MASDVLCFIFKVHTYLSGTSVNLILHSYKYIFLTGRILMTTYNILKYLSCIKIAHNNNNNDIFKVFVCPMRNSHMFSCSEVKIAFCFAVINSVANITLKTINDSRAEFFRKHIFKMKMAKNFRW